MAAGLPHDAIAGTAERFIDRTATSCRNHLIPYEMQTDQFRSHSDVEMALHGVPYLAWLHVLNAFAIFMGALMTGRWAFTEAAAPASEPVAAA